MIRNISLYKKRSISNLLEMVVIKIGACQVIIQRSQKVATNVSLNYNKVSYEVIVNISWRSHLLDFSMRYCGH